MVEKIYDAKSRVLGYMDKTLEKYGPDEMDVTKVDKLADIVKDLSEAEKACWEAEYYRSVTEAMEDGGYGYMPEGMGYGGQGGGQGGGRSGYRGRDHMGRYTSGRRGYGSMGYHGHIDELREQMESATPDEREKMKRELRQLVDSK